MAFQEIEEMQIKLAAVDAAEHTHIHSYIYNSTNTQFKTLMPNNLPQKLAYKMYCNLFTGER